MNIFLEGFFLQASLILALGAQNIFVLESGIKKQRPLLVALICSLCDISLIAIGVLGAASIFVRFPNLKIIFGLLGVFFLLYYGVIKLKEFFQKEVPTEEKSVISKRDIIALSLSFSLLNPHVYLDTVVLIGGFSAKFSSLSERAIFGLGAGFFSSLWFFGLAIFSSFFNKLMHDHTKMRVIYLVSGIVLIILSFVLLKDVIAWL